MNNKKQITPIGKYLHQLFNHSIMIRNYAEYFTLAIKDKNIAHICRQLDSNIYTLLVKLTIAIGRKELHDFVDRKIINSPRMLNLMRINEMCSRLNDESIEIVANSLEQQLQPILDAEFNQNQKTIKYAE
jgi:hypothetical protein